MSTIIKNLIPYFEKDKCKYWIEEYGYLAEVFYPGVKKPFFVVGSMIGLNNSSVVKILSDKIYTKKILNRHGFNVPNGILIIPHKNQFFTKKHRELVWKFVEQNGFPLIWKPINGSLGDGVVFIQNKKVLEEQIKYADNLSNLFVLEKYIKGKEYRITVFDGDILFAYEKIGNGLVKNIAKGSLMKKTILSKKEVQRIKDISNLFGIKVAGFDVISNGSIDKGTILEINANPGLKGLNLLSSDFQKKFWKNMWKNVLKTNNIK